jgi:hypothetical protein
MTSDSQNKIKDDEVLAQLYKKGAKETPPAKLNHEIINYAADPDKSHEAPKPVGSHFGGGWKVPLSMAASVVVVFALLLQLDQSPQQLELPPIPELSIPTEDSVGKSQPIQDEHNEELYEAEEALADDTSSFENDTKETDMDSQNTGALIIDKPANTETQRSTDSIQAKPDIIEPGISKQDSIKKSVDKKTEKKIELLRERVQSQQEPTSTPSAPTSSSSSTITKYKSEEGYAPPKLEKLAKPQATQDRLNSNAPDTSSGAASGTTSGSVKQERSMSESRGDNSTTSGMAADAELTDELRDENIQTEAEFAPIPVEDWLLMIERLVARKDYAEAARQLEKFKQAHPKVNVEDLDAKIP